MLPRRRLPICIMSKSKTAIGSGLRAAILVCSLLATQLPVTAQQVKQRIPIITLGRIAPAELKNGKTIPTLTTRQEILKNALLLADVNNCRVTEYKFTIIAPGQPYYGPLYITGGDLTDSIKNKIKEQDGPGVKVYIEEVKMNYRGNIMDANSVYLTYDH
jgi:hypothetical protein